MDETQMFIKAAPGRLVRDPITMQKLAEGGEKKPRITYWNRRLRDGDVVECEEPAAPRAAKAKE